MKHEWRKSEKTYYLPKPKPEVINIPNFKFFSVKGEGNPGSEAFPNYIEVLYTLSYAIRMSHKKGTAPDNFFEYTVYPLEGIWDIKEEAKAGFDGMINKDDLMFNLMIRQPEFVTSEYAESVISQARESNSNPLFKDVVFEEITEGNCIQMLHIGSYDNEPESFSKMEEFATSHGLERKSKIHREIYLSDARKVAPEKLKTVLRFKLK